MGLHRVLLKCVHHCCSQDFARVLYLLPLHMLDASPIPTPLPQQHASLCCLGVADAVRNRHFVAETFLSLLRTYSKEEPERVFGRRGVLLWSNR